jgi:hypothetical protein
MSHYVLECSDNHQTTVPSFSQDAYVMLFEYTSTPTWSTLPPPVISTDL